MERIDVKDILHKNDEYVVIIEDELTDEKAGKIRDGGRMLVDSDALAFVYVLEDDEQLYYLIFSEQTWKTLKEIRDQHKDVHISLNENKHIVLQSIASELDFLTENIDGNGNYGEKMEQAVMGIFT